MNDPHVARLVYKLDIAHSLVIEKDTDVDRGAYRLLRHGKHLDIEVREHFATVRAAPGRCSSGLPISIPSICA